MILSYHDITYMTHHYDHFHHCRTLVTSLEVDMTQCWGCQVNTRCATVSDTILQTAAAMATTTWAITIRQGEYFTQILQKDRKKIKRPGLSPQSAVFTVQNGHFSSMHFLHNILYTCTVLCKCTELFSCKIFSPCPRLSPPASTISAGRRSQSPNITRKTSKGLEKYLRKL